MFRFRDIQLFAMFLALVGCSNMCSKSRLELSPEEVVQAYLDISLNMNQLDQKKQLVNLTTGSLRNAIESASDQTLTEAFIDKYYHLENYAVVERRDRTPRETEITFILAYRDRGKEGKFPLADSPQITTENTVSVVRYKGAWAIRDVLGKNTSIDFPVKQGSTINASP